MHQPITTSLRSIERSRTDVTPGRQTDRLLLGRKSSITSTEEISETALRLVLGRSRDPVESESKKSDWVSTSKSEKHISVYTLDGVILNLASNAMSPEREPHVEAFKNHAVNIVGTYRFLQMHLTNAIDASALRTPNVSQCLLQAMESRAPTS